MNPDPPTREFTQSVIVIRHGDRKDNFEPLWIKTAERPWDPPLIDPGFTRAYTQGTKLKSAYPFSISRAFVSPFLRCVQTASQLVSALANPDSSDNAIKVAIEFGLCEVLSPECIRPESAPKDGKFDFDIPELEKILAAKIETSVNSVYEKMPDWGEVRLEARKRYLKVIEELANRYCDENLLLVTHGEGVGACSAYLEGKEIYEVDYCGYVHLTRNVAVSESGKLVDAKRFKFEENEGQTGRLVPEDGKNFHFQIGLMLSSTCE